VDHAGTQAYTRAGAFRQNAANDLINIDGDRVQGYGVDSNFNIQQGQLVPLNIPVGTLTLAQATRNVHLVGNLNSDGALPTQGSRTTFNPLTLISGPIGGPGGPALATTSLLTGIDNSASPGTPLFLAGQTLRLSGAEKGQRQLPDALLPITATTTVQDLGDFPGRGPGNQHDRRSQPQRRNAGDFAGRCDRHAHHHREYGHGERHRARRDRPPHPRRRRDACLNALHPDKRRGGDGRIDPHHHDRLRLARVARGG
jgi:hypothetical protein